MVSVNATRPATGATVDRPLIDDRLSGTIDQADNQDGANTQALLSTIIAEIGVGGDIIRVELKEYAGRKIFSAWRFYRNRADELKPGRHGLSFSIERLPEIADAFAAAVREARRCRLLPVGGG